MPLNFLQEFIYKSTVTSKVKRKIKNVDNKIIIFFGKNKLRMTSWHSD